MLYSIANNNMLHNSLYTHLLYVFILVIAPLLLLNTGFIPVKKIKLLSIYSITSICFVISFVKVIIEFINLKHGQLIRLLHGTILLDRQTLLYVICILFLFFIVLLLVCLSPNKDKLSDNLCLMFISVSGALIMVSTTNLLVMFLSLEMMSIPLYVLCINIDTHIFRLRFLSAESGIKYFIIGSVASSIFLFGAALIYGYTGTVDLLSAVNIYYNNDPMLLHYGSSLLFLIGVTLIIITYLIKLGIFPFNFWIIDVYEGAPKYITAFMSSVIKSAVVFTLLNLEYRFISIIKWDILNILVILSILTIIFASILMLKQNKLKRFFSYSSVLNAGYLSLAISAIHNVSTLSIILFMFIYGVSSIAVFVFEDIFDNANVKVTNFMRGISIYIIASLIGLPLTGGFIVKILLFQSMILNKYYYMVMVIVLLSNLIAGYGYLKVIINILKYKDNKLQNKQVTLSKIPLNISTSFVLISSIIFFIGIFSNSFLLMLKGII